VSDIESIEERAGRRREVLRLLRASPAPMSILAIADELGVHPNTVRFHLDILVGDGQVQQVAPGRKGPGRPPLMFQAVRQMDRGGTRHYRLLAEILSTALAAERNPAGKALAAGRAWGLRLESGLQSPPEGGTGAEESIDRLVEVLDGLGFAPERRASNGAQQIGLRHCPFLELAETRTTVVCPIHLGLMQGALETWAAPVSVDRLDAFVEPDLCVAHLTGAGVAAEGFIG
jgi:predicted ArsR family transcriptional regulator